MADALTCEMGAVPSERNLVSACMAIKLRTFCSICSVFCVFVCGMKNNNMAAVRTFYITVSLMTISNETLELGTCTEIDYKHIFTL
jgi:hypothetical protein